ncbi:MAG: pyrroloquinoline-quinone synthase PqqC [Alphaproteobacteria bacterium]
MSGAPLSPDEFEAALRAIGAERYHDKHPFHALLHGGKLRKGQVQAWALNRYCYQAHIPIKDAILLSRMTDPTLRRVWRVRIEDHDGTAEHEGGIARWLKLTDGLGLPRDVVVSMQRVLPATRFAVEAYVHFVAERPLLDGIASSLTELFAPKIHRERIAGMLEHYDFVDETTLSYFRKRLEQVTGEADFALNYVKKEARTVETQQRVLQALRFKCDVLWTQLDALAYAYVEPRRIPPGAFRPENGA